MELDLVFDLGLEVLEFEKKKEKNVQIITKGLKIRGIKLKPPHP